MFGENGVSRLERLEKRLKRRKKIQNLPLKKLKDHLNPLEYYDEVQFKLRFHMFKDTAIYIINLIKSDLCSPIKRGVHVPAVIQFLVVLRFYCTGSFQLVIGDLENFSQGTISNLVKRVSIALAKMGKKVIKYPSHQEAAAIKSGFFEIGSFPGVVGCIDCTHIQINSPGGEEAELFRNRKGNFSVNVQGICDHELNFTNLVVRWYGSAHDARIFEESGVYLDLETGKSPGILLGDAGYGCSIFLMTPLPHPKSRSEKKYQKAQLSTRNTIERTFGIWKKKFPCLNYLRTKLKTTLIIIVATGVLHNITRRRGDLYENDQFEIEAQQTLPTLNAHTSTMSGRALQKSIIESSFS